MSKDKELLSPTLIRFQQDLQLNGITERSQESYGGAARTSIRTCTSSCRACQDELGVVVDVGNVTLNMVYGMRR